MVGRPNENFEAAKIKRGNILSSNNTLWYGAGILDYLNVSAMYAMYATTALTALFLSTAIFVIYPIFFAFRLIDAYCCITNAIHEHNSKGGVKAHNLVNAIVTALTVILVGAAVAGTIFGAPLLATVMFGANLVLMAAFRIGVGAYEAGKASVAHRLHKDGEESRKGVYKMRAFSQFYMAMCLLMTASTGICISVLGLTVMWPLGVIGGVLGALLCAYGIYMSQGASAKVEVVDLTDDFQAGSDSDSDDTTMRLQRGLGVEPRKSSVPSRADKTEIKIEDLSGVTEAGTEPLLSGRAQNSLYLTRPLAPAPDAIDRLPAARTSRGQ